MDKESWKLDFQLFMLLVLQTPNIILLEDFSIHPEASLTVPDQDFMTAVATIGVSQAEFGMKEINCVLWLFHPSLILSLFFIQQHLKSVGIELHPM